MKDHLFEGIWGSEGVTLPDTSELCQNDEERGDAG